LFDTRAVSKPALQSCNTQKGDHLKKLMLVISLFTAQAYAQGQSTVSLAHDSSAQQSIAHINPFIGMAMMGIRSTNGNSDYGAGLTTGAMGEIGGALAFQSGLVYNQFGGKDGGVEIDLDYLSVPLFLKYNALGTPENSLYVRGGLMPSFLVSKKAKFAGYETSELSARALDIPVVIGFGAAIPVGPKVAMTLGLDIVHSLTNTAGTFRGEAHNDGFLFTTGASIGL
jgi:hypothetical protein